MRKLIDEYLDNAMDPAQRAQLEQQIAADPAKQRLLAGMKHERALRSAAYASFEPARPEAYTLGSRMLEAIMGHQPAGSIGLWLKRGLAVAAALAIVAASFAFGRVTASPPSDPGQTVKIPAPGTDLQVVYRVVYLAEFGEKEVREFPGLDEANEFVNKLDTRRSEARVAAIDLDSPGSF